MTMMMNPVKMTGAILFWIGRRRRIAPRARQHLIKPIHYEMRNSGQNLVNKTMGSSTKKNSISFALHGL